MDRNFPANQAEALAQLYSNRVVSNIRHLRANISSSETPIKDYEDNQARILKDANNKTTAPSHIRHFYIPDESLDSMEEERLENYHSMSEPGLMMNEDERAMTFISFTVYQIHTFDPMLFCDDTGAPPFLHR